jgi:hypothetical protein
MSNRIREMLKRLKLLEQTTHEQRLEIDREIERITGEDCDRAIERKLIDEETFKAIVSYILSKKKKKAQVETEKAMVV